ncbi:MAG TPA: pyridoxal phosphate-dependent aminotransferase [Clostridia bacterium]|nr:pyridoxal phosphate-dependent aminotransferase [Clostridia bacterium]
MSNKDCPDYCSQLTLAYGRQKSAIRELFEYGKEKSREAGGESVFDFSIGNPSVPPPRQVDEAFHCLLEEHDALKLHGYTSAPGDPAVRSAIADQLNRDYKIDCDETNLYLTCGAAAALSSTFRALMICDQRNEFIVSAPYFPEYKFFVEGHGGHLLVVPPKLPDFGISLEGFKQAITSSTRAVIINSPNNPSGRLYKENEIRELGDLLNRKAEEYGHPIYIVSDEPYRELVYDGLKAPFIPLLYHNTLVCYSYSKTLSMPGERIGYVLVPPKADHARDVYDAVAGAARSLGYVCAPSLVQRVVGLCVDVKPNLAQYDANRTTLYDGLTSAGYHCIKPEGAFYLFVKAPGGDAQAFSDFARTRYNLLIVPSESFGFPGYLRISYCVSHERIVSSLPLFAQCLQAYEDG